MNRQDRRRHERRNNGVEWIQLTSAYARVLAVVPRRESRLGGKCPAKTASLQLAKATTSIDRNEFLWGAA